MTRWTKFMTALKLDEKVDFEEGDIGLAGGLVGLLPSTNLIKHRNVS